MQKRVLFAVIAVVMATSPAYALSIKNLSGTQQTLVMEQGGHRQAITLAPSATQYLVGGDMTLAMPGQRPQQAKFEEEYVIWPDGQMIIQKRQKVKGGIR